MTNTETRWERVQREAPTACGDRQRGFVCEREPGHDGHHRAGCYLDGQYMGEDREWPAH